MIGKKINQLATELAPTTTDLTIIGDPISGVSKKITLEQLGAIFGGAVSFYTTLGDFPATGVIDIIYCAKDTKKLYLWSGSAYVEVFPSQSLLDTYQLRSEKGVSNGYASLDVNGKVPIGQLPNSIMEYKGTWSAATNTPTLANGTGDTGDVYLCNAAGTVNFGAGPITFAVGDYVVYSGSIYQRSSGAVGTVTSVAASITGDSITISNSPISTSGTLAFAFAGTSSQYINGAGNLTTFPTLTGYVPYTGATANVDLGTHTLSAKDLVINHSSGSGVAASITKGGAGEALTVVKSSGSGNAASITGGVTLLDELHLTTDLADAYIASASNWNAAYNDKINSAAVTGTTTKTLTLTQQDGGTITASWTDDNTDAVTSVFGRTGAVVATSGDYNTSQVTENTNLYFTNARAIASTLTGYTSGAGTISATDTILSAIQKLNGNIGALTTGVSSVNGLTGAVTLTTSNIAEGTNLYYTEARVNANTNVAANTAARHNAVTLGTANGLSLSTQVLSLALASGSTTGALSSTDWTTFNNKQNALTNPVTGTGTTNYLPKFTGTSTIGNSAVTDDGTTVSLLSRALSGTSATFSTTLQTTGLLSRREASGSDGYIAYLTTGVQNTVMGFNNSGSTNAQGVLNNYSYFGNLNSYGLQFTTNGTVAMTINTSGNLGLGVTPSAWGNNSKPLQMADGSIWGISSLTGYVSVGGNYYYDGNFKYIKTSNATDYYQYDGQHVWRNAPSGTAGNAISFTQAMTLNASGNLSVGNTNDTYKLDVTGTARFTGQVTSETQFYAVATPPATNGGLINVRDTVTATNVTSFAGVFFNSSPGNDYSIGKLTENNYGFLQIRNANNGAELLRINSTGAATFSSSVTAVSGLINGTTDAFFDINRSASGNAGRVRFQTAGTDEFEIGLKGGVAGFHITKGDATELVTVLTSGNVGIGTTSPNNIFTIYAASSAIYTQWIQSGTGTTSTDGLRIGLDASSNGIIDLNEGTALITKVDGSERMRITSGGNVGIGNTGANAKLEVTASSGEVFRADAASGAYRIIANQTQVLLNGNVGIGTASPAALLHIEKASQDNILAVIGQSGYEGALFLSGAGSGKDANIVVGNGRNLEFHTSSSTTPVVDGTERMRITSSGNVEINTGSIKTGEPDTGYGRAAVKIGARNTGQAFDSGGHLPVNIDGTIYYINLYSSLP